MEWDQEVDVVCTDSGAAGLASAMIVVDGGGEAFVAESIGHAAPDRTTALSAPRTRGPWPGFESSDYETNQYLAEISGDLGPMRRSAWDLNVPIRVVNEIAPAQAGGGVAPFIGARLREWAARCLSSPYGFLYTRLTNWQSNTLYTDDGEAIEAYELGAMNPDPNDVGGSVLDWLTAHARERGIESHPDTYLDRIVFEEGEVVGAVFTTPDGPFAVRARHGVSVATGGPIVSALANHRLAAGDASVRVCLVGQYASRFGRLELHTSEQLEQQMSSTCRPANRHLRANLRDTHGDSHKWRCGKVHGYPPFGQ